MNAALKKITEASASGKVFSAVKKEVLMAMGRITCAVCALGLAFAPSAGAQPEAAWEETPAFLALRWQGQELWRLHFGEDCPKPFFDPLAPVGGPSLSWEAPPDHPWHHGLWFSWKFMNGVN